MLIVIKYSPSVASPNDIEPLKAAEPTGGQSLVASMHGAAYWTHLSPQGSTGLSTPRLKGDAALSNLFIGPHQDSRQPRKKHPGLDTHQEFGKKTATLAM